jgi:hypothetical protein
MQFSSFQAAIAASFPRFRGAPWVTYLTDQLWNPSTTPNVAYETKAKIVDDLTPYALTF